MKNGCFCCNKNEKKPVVIFSFSDQNYKDLSHVYIAFNCCTQLFSTKSCNLFPTNYIFKTCYEYTFSTVLTSLCYDDVIFCILDTIFRRSAGNTYIMLYSNCIQFRIATNSVYNLKKLLSRLTKRSPVHTSQHDKTISNMACMHLKHIVFYYFDIQRVLTSPSAFIGLC